MDERERGSSGALPSDRAFVPSASSPQAVSPVPASIPGAEREAELVRAVGIALSNLGNAQGYFPSIGGPNTRRLIAAYRAYGLEPEFGKAFKW